MNVEADNDDAVSLMDDPGDWEFVSVTYIADSEQIVMEIEAGFSTTIRVALSPQQALDLAELLRKKATRS